MNVYEYRGVVAQQAANGLIKVRARDNRLVALTTDLAHAVAQFVAAVRE